MATENNCEPVAASVLVAESSPGAIFFNWRSRPAVPKETISPSVTPVAPAKFVKFAVEPSASAILASVILLALRPSVEEPAPTATALAWVARAPVPKASEFIPLASDIVPKAVARSPAAAFTPKATDASPAVVPLYPPKPDVFPVKSLYISSKLWLFTAVLVSVSFLS